MDEGRFSISVPQLYNRLGTAASETATPKRHGAAGLVALFPSIIGSHAQRRGQPFMHGLYNRVRRSVVIVALLALLPASAVSAAELKVLSGGAMRAPLQELASAFEKSSGHRVVIEYGMVGKVEERMVAGDPVDVTILTKLPLDRLASAGKIVGGTAVPLVRVPIALAVKHGAPRPDISSVEVFKQTLLAAKSIAYGDPAIGDAAGAHMEKVIETLGLTAVTKPKTRHISGQPSPDILAGMVQRGEAEIAIAPVGVLGETRGVDIVGLLPAEIQSPDLTFFAAISSTSAHPADAKAFVDFLAGSAAGLVYRGKGMAPSEAD